jgi:hypothetical protein
MPDRAVPLLTEAADQFAWELSLMLGFGQRPVLIAAVIASG